MLCFTMTRVVAWAVLWTLIVAMLLSPLMGTRPCSLWNVRLSARSYLLYGGSGPGESLPALVSHLGSGILLGALLTVFVDPARRFDSSWRTHRLAAVYAVAAAVECVAIQMMPWAIHLCNAVQVTSSVLSWAGMMSGIFSILLVGISGLTRLALVSVQDTIVTKIRRLLAIAFTFAIAAGTTGFVGISSLLINASFCIPAIVAYCRAQWLIYAGITSSTKEAITDVGDTVFAARFARWTAAAAIAATASCIAWSISFLFKEQIPSLVGFWLREAFYVIDRWSNTILVFLSAGLIGPKRNPERELMELGNWIQERRKQHIVKAIRDSARATSGPSLMLAALFESSDPDELLANAMKRFRRVSWDVLKHHPEIILQGATIDIAGPGGADLYNLSEPCKFSECDAFWSHSWRDDANLKWSVMSHWCEVFRQQNGRAPNLWLDKVCIDQSDIRRDLQCLPIFLAACNDLVVCSGCTYTTRLWCCFELFVYTRLLAEDNTRRPPVVLPLFSNEDERATIRHAWRSFDARLCDCVVADDKARIIGIIELYTGGVLAFNTFIGDLGREMFEEAPQDMGDEVFEDAPQDGGDWNEEEQLSACSSSEDELTLTI
eukprot:TRINITY_DN5804_c1_g2_i3.p1 TRINITY_DN5804_c1_g2~~TRINITY_DN5804_c1_g2_i3.p1  ORF type:complete len:605 (-),score=81.10 TRINITY_DN5804_c1_g2_i3:52-1866(-)